MYVALVDVCGGEEYVELIRSALQAALEAMPAGALFGLITFSTRVRRGYRLSCCLRFGSRTCNLYLRNASATKQVPATLMTRFTEHRTRRHRCSPQGTASLSAVSDH
jgi:hypothetical protein